MPKIRNEDGSVRANPTTMEVIRHLRAGYWKADLASESIWFKEPVTVLGVKMTQPTGENSKHKLTRWGKTVGWWDCQMWWISLGFGIVSTVVQLLLL